MSEESTETWEDAIRASKAIEAVNSLPEAKDFDEEQKFLKAQALVKAGDEAINVILAKKESSGFFPPGTREPPLETVSGGLYSGKNYDQVKEDVLERSIKMAKEHPEEFQELWHKSNLPIGLTRKGHFADQRFGLGRPSKRT